jgi:hypothetical protein
MVAAQKKALGLFHNGQDLEFMSVRNWVNENSKRRTYVLGVTIDIQSFRGKHVLKNDVMSLNI